MKYKVGDEVIIKSYEKMKKIYEKGDQVFLSDKENIKRFGKSAIITEIKCGAFNRCNIYYMIDIDTNNNYNWEEDDFEGLVDKKKVSLIMKDLLDNNN